MLCFRGGLFRLSDVCYCSGPQCDCFLLNIFGDSSSWNSEGIMPCLSIISMESWDLCLYFSFLFRAWFDFLSGSLISLFMAQMTWSIVLLCRLCIYNYRSIAPGDPPQLSSLRTIALVGTSDFYLIIFFIVILFLLVFLFREDFTSLRAGLSELPSTEFFGFVPGQFSLDNGLYNKNLFSFKLLQNGEF